jgi:hypothetical protein
MSMIERRKQHSVATVFGFAIYYLFPLSLLSLNVELLVDLFVAILCGMLLSMVTKIRSKHKSTIARKHRLLTLFSIDVRACAFQVLLSLNVVTPLQSILAFLLFRVWEADIVTT